MSGHWRDPYADGMSVWGKARSALRLQRTQLSAMVWSALLNMKRPRSHGAEIRALHRVGVQRELSNHCLYNWVGWAKFQLVFKG